MKRALLVFVLSLAAGIGCGPPPDPPDAGPAPHHGTPGGCFGSGSGDMFVCLHADLGGAVDGGTD